MSCLRDRIYQKILLNPHPGCVVRLLRCVLYVLSLGYSSIMRILAFCYLHEVCASFRPKAFVVSVGNITVGGTGKTPFILFLTKFFEDKKTAVLLRGYRSEAEVSNSCAQVTEMCSAKQVGDEAVLIQKRSPHVSVYVGRKRACAAQQAMSCGAEILLLDDGMQHMQIARDVDICLIDATAPFGGGYVLPRGLLREPLCALQRVSCIVITRVDRDVSILEEHIRKYTQAPIVHAVMRMKGLYQLDGTCVHLSAGAQVALISAIGNPKSFQDMIVTAGFHVVETQSLPDHNEIEEAILRQFCAIARQKGAVAVICTEKDATKIPKECKELVVVMHIDLELTHNATALTALLEID